MWIILHSLCIRISRLFRGKSLRWFHQVEPSDDELIARLNQPTPPIRRLTIGSMMSLVALFAVLLWFLMGVVAERQQWRQARRHSRLASSAEFSLLNWEYEAKRHRRAIEKSRQANRFSDDRGHLPGPLSENSELDEYQQGLDNVIRAYRTKARFHQEMSEKYRQAARFRWSRVDPDPPEPPEPVLPTASNSAAVP